MAQGVSYVHHSGLYIRNLIPGDVGSSVRRLLAYRGGAMLAAFVKSVTININTQTYEGGVSL
jgi:hypothetical protein